MSSPQTLSDPLEPVYALIRDRLRQARKERDLTLREAAREIGRVSAPTLSRLERGDGRPDWKTVGCLMDWLDLERGAVFGANGATPGSTPKRVQVILESDPTLSPKAAKKLARVFKSAYKELSTR